MRGPYLTALRYALIEQTRNRLAFGLLLLFVPIWYALLGGLVASAALPFRFRVTGAFLLANGRDLALLTAGLNALTLIAGFTLYAATRGGSQFDRRLVLCGYRQATLMAAKVTTLLVVAAGIALYASLVLLAYWRPVNFPLVWLSYAGAALIYGAQGILLGVLVRSELAGFFLIIMLSLMDTWLQNPYGNPVANKPILQWFPAYGPMQVAVAGGFTHVMPGRELLVGLVWAASLALVGLVIFWWRTRPWQPRGRVARTLAPAAG
jgi:ABC-2 type transport system permease protein